MLTSLFKPAWKSSSVEKRLNAIAAMNGENSDNQDVLIQLAQDSESSVSIAAINKLTSVATLLELLKNQSNNVVLDEINLRIEQLLSSTASLNEAQYRELLTSHPELSGRIAALASFESVRIEAIEKLSPDQLLQVLGAAMYTDVRQQVAQKLSALDELETARKIIHGKDKKTERTLKIKIDELRKIERIHTENLATVEKLVDEAEYLSSHDWLPEFQAKYLAHCTQWDQLEFDIEAAAKQRYQSSRNTMDSRYQEQKLIEETQQSQKNLVDEITAFVQSVANRNISESIHALPETLSMLEQYASKWQELALKSMPDSALQNQFDRIMPALKSATQLISVISDVLPAEANTTDAEATNDDNTSTEVDLTSLIGKLNSALKKLKWPAVHAELKIATQLQQQLDDWRKQKETAAAEREQKLAQLHKKISTVFRLSRAGNLARAKQTFERAEKSLSHFSGKEHAKLEERLEEARKTMGDMGDWKNFATEPKYIELCEAMELLQNSKLNPDKLSKKIKDLQQQWKALGHSEISDQYWPRFKDTADKVYKPCAEFFDMRHQTRKANLEQRQQTVEQMRKLLESTDWDNDPDYKSIQTEVRKIGDQFFEIKDVEHGPGQKQWKAFSKLKDQVYAKLDVAYEANIALKQQLVDQAAALAETEAREENLAKLKTLQTRWKNIGITKRNADQKAWKEFKKQGDIVFNNVQALRKGQRDEVDQQLNAYRAIIKEIQKLAKTAKDLSQSDQQFAELQSKYDQLPELPESLPEKLTRGIQQDYRKACDQFGNSHTRILNNMHNQQIDALRNKADLCARLEALGESPSDEELQKISQQWDAIELKDAQLAKRIEARRNAAQQPIDRDEIGAQRRMLCIKLEIAVGKESPSEDKSIRMQYQLDQMNKSGLGQQAVNSSNELENMEIDWLCMPGTEPTLQKTLDKRFKQVLKLK